MADFERRLERTRRIQNSCHRRSIERIIPDRINPLEFLSRLEVRERNRFQPESIFFLLQLLHNSIECATFRSSPLQPVISLLVTLNYFASGAHYMMIGDRHGVSKSSVCRAIERTSAVISSLRDRYIKFPGNDQVKTIQREFYNIARFQKVLGVIDGTQIRIKGPSQNEPDFVNRKGFHSINVQMVCDAKFRVTNVVAKWPGSVHDSRIFRESELCRKFENGEIDGLLLGDSGYACKPSLMTPYTNPQTTAQERFNSALTRTRVIIEQTFGVMKRSFPCLTYGLRMKTINTPLVIVSCVVLHNFGMETGDTFERTVDTDLDLPDVHGETDQAGARCRDSIAAKYFA